MKENDWISVKDFMPPIDTEIEIKFYEDDDKIEPCIFGYGKHPNYFVFWSGRYGASFVANSVTHWRHIKSDHTTLTEKNDWIDPRDRLPNLGDKVEIKDRHEETFICDFNINGNGYIGFIANLCLMYDFEKIIGWRNYIEKRPDLSKLNKGDLISIDDTISGYFCSFIKDKIFISQYKIGALYQDLETERIKKITRINIEDQTFEEI